MFRISPHQHPFHASEEEYGWLHGWLTQLSTDCLQHPSSCGILSGHPHHLRDSSGIQPALLSLRTFGNTDLLPTHTNCCEFKLMCYLSQVAHSHSKLAWSLLQDISIISSWRHLKSRRHVISLDQVGGGSGDVPSLALILAGNFHPS